MKASEIWKWRNRMTWLAVWLVWAPTMWVVSASLVWTIGPGVQVAQAQGGPATTQVKDTVYRADGSPAEGVLLISWGGFTTADGKPVAAGNTSATIGANGALSVNLVPNVGAAPANAYYQVVYQLNDNSVHTEYWVVPAESPAKLAQVRATPGTGSTASLVSKQYVDSAIAGKAADGSVVHLSGLETIAGTKQFATSPSVPSPVNATDAVNKAYVDQALTGVGSGSFVSKAGDSMSGPLILPSDPTSASQASTKHYVDTASSGKASLIGGVVPPSQLGSGTANSTMCLKGDSSWARAERARMRYRFRAWRSTRPPQPTGRC